MCSGNKANPQTGLNGKVGKKSKMEMKQLRREAELDAIAKRRRQKEKAMDAEMKAMRQDARAQQKAQQFSSPAPAVASAPAPSVAAESMQIVAGGNSGNRAPTAALSGRKGRRARAKGPSSSLRIDPASSVAGVGPNIAV